VVFFRPVVSGVFSVGPISLPISPAITFLAEPTLEFFAEDGHNYLAKSLTDLWIYPAA
jgi:hypothetical protein